MCNAFDQMCVEKLRARMTSVLRTVLTCDEKEPTWIDVYDVCYHICRLVEGARKNLNKVMCECLNEACIMVWSTYAFKEGLSGYAVLMEKRVNRIGRIITVPPSFGTSELRDGSFILQEVMRLWGLFTLSMAKITCAHFEKGITTAGLLPPDMAHLIAHIALTNVGVTPPRDASMVGSTYK